MDCGGKRSATPLFRETVTWSTNSFKNGINTRAGTC
jgi:hypothetical protein